MIAGSANANDGMGASSSTSPSRAGRGIISEWRTEARPSWRSQAGPSLPEASLPACSSWSEWSEAVSSSRWPNEPSLRVYELSQPAPSPPSDASS